MSNQFDKYQSYSGIIKRLLLFTGLWSSTNPSTLYRLVPFIHCTASLFTCFTLINFASQHIASLHLFFKAFSSALSFLTGVLKVCCLTYYREHLVELHIDLATTFDLDLNDIELRPILLSPLLSFYRPSLILSAISYMAVVMYLITPTLFIVIQIVHGVDFLKFILPYPGSYPWEPNANIWLYLSHYTFEIYVGMFLGTCTAVIDALFGFYIFQICGQLRTLSHRLRTFKSNDNYRKVISECMSRHQILARCQDHLEQIYGPIVLWMLVTNSIILCALIYQAAHLSPEKAMTAMIHIALKSAQILVYGWYGSFLETEHDAFQKAIYASDWAGSGEKCLMTDVLIMMTYKPFVLRACSLANISIDMFVAVCNTAMSYYFMIRTLEEQDNKT